PGHLPGPGTTRVVHRDDGRGQFDARRLYPLARARGGRARPCRGLCPLPAPLRAAHAARRHALRRGAPDAGARARADDEAAPPAARRTEPRPRAPDRAGNLPHRHRAARPRRLDPAGRAERARSAGNRRLRLCAGNRLDRAQRQGGGPHPRPEGGRELSRRLRELTAMETESALRRQLAQAFAPAQRTLPAMLARQAQRHGDKPLASAGDASWTFAQTAVAAARMAGALRAAGIAAGDRVAIICANRIELIGLLIGCGWLGAVAVPINVASRGPQLQHILTNSGARLLVMEPAFAENLTMLDADALALQAIWTIGEPGEFRFGRIA